MNVAHLGPSDATVEVHFDSHGRVYYASDWTRMYSLARDGYVSRRSHGPDTYGHTDYFLPDDEESR